MTKISEINFKTMLKFDFEVRDRLPDMAGMYTNCAIKAIYSLTLTYTRLYYKLFCPPPLPIPGYGKFQGGNLRSWKSIRQNFYVFYLIFPVFYFHAGSCRPTKKIAKKADLSPLYVCIFSEKKQCFEIYIIFFYGKMRFIRPSNPRPFAESL